MTTPAPSLKALAESKAEGVAKATYFKLHPSVVGVDPGWNGRDAGPDLDAHVATLKAAMLAGAYIPPIDVQMVDGSPIVRDGHCRLRAANEIIADGGDYTLEARQIRGDETDMLVHMLGTASGRPLSPLEQGRVYLRLRAYGMSVAEIAAKTGQHRSTIENGQQLAEMPVAVQKLVGQGKVASHLALKTVKQHGKEAPAKLAAAIKEAESKGKTKATSKHVNGPKVRGQTLPPSEAVATTGPKAIVGEAAIVLPPPSESVVLLRQLAERVAALNIVVSHIDRAAVVDVVQAARNLLGVK